MKRSEHPLYSSTQILTRVGELAAQLSRDLQGQDVTALIVLKGALHFGSDLVRAMTIPVMLDFVRVKSYLGTATTGLAEMLVRPTEPIRGRTILIVEDILDSGLTAQALVEYLREQGAAKVLFCTLFDKPSRRKTPVHADYIGFTVDNQFIVGYGMDYEERYRDLRDVYILEQEY